MVIWFFARAIFVWLYNRTGSSVLLVPYLPCQLRWRNQPVLLRRRAGVEPGEIHGLPLSSAAISAVCSARD